MTQFYIGAKQVEAWAEERDGAPGFAIKYADGYRSWCPADVFQRSYFPMGFEIRDDASFVAEESVTATMVDRFIARIDFLKMGDRTTVAVATLVNGYVVTEASSCVDPARYVREIGEKIAAERVREKVWELLGFLLRTARFGVLPPLPKAEPEDPPLEFLFRTGGEPPASA